MIKKNYIRHGFKNCSKYNIIMYNGSWVIFIYNTHDDDYIIISELWEVISLAFMRTNVTMDYTNQTETKTIYQNTRAHAIMIIQMYFVLARW